VIHEEWFTPKQTTFTPVEGTTNCLQITHHGGGGGTNKKAF